MTIYIKGTNIAKSLMFNGERYIFIESFWGSGAKLDAERMARRIQRDGYVKKVRVVRRKGFGQNAGMIVYRVYGIRRKK